MNTLEFHRLRLTVFMALIANPKWKTWRRQGRRRVRNPDVVYAPRPPRITPAERFAIESKLDFTADNIDVRD